MSWPITYQRRVRYGDVDSQGIVFNANYLDYYDDAITDLFLAAGLTPDVTHRAGYDVVTAHASIDFRATAALFDTLNVGVRVGAIGNTSVTFEVESCDMRSRYRKSAELRRTLLRLVLRYGVGCDRKSAQQYRGYREYAGERMAGHRDLLREAEAE